MSGRVKNAVISRIADDRRIPIAAAAHTYACMPMAKKNTLCAAEQRKALPAGRAALEEGGRRDG